MKKLTIIAFLLGIVVFVLPNAHAEEIKTFFINSQMVDCVGVGPMKCMQVREDLNSEWSNFYDKIQGFEFNPGNTYTIKVKVTDVENSPADASSKKYELIEILNQESLSLPTSSGEETKTFFINSQMVDCVGVGPMKCMQVREDLNSEWSNFYDKIQGFEFNPGNEYTVKVKVTDIENPPADASSKKYELVEILHQESVTKHFPLNNLCAPGFVALGEICVLNDRCGPGAYAGKVCIMDGEKQPYLRPSQQGNSGISADNTICAEGMRLIFKSHNGSPACVKPKSVNVLKERGWQTFMPVVACTLEYNPMCGTDGTTYGNRCMLDSAHIGLKHEGGCQIDINEINLDVTQKELRDMVNDWMNNMQENDRQQRLHIMISYYAFEESGKELTTDQDGLQLMNQIRKMVSIDLPKEELDDLRESIREKLKDEGLDVKG